MDAGGVHNNERTSMIDQRDHLFRQLRELKELLDMSAIDEDDLIKQRSTILKDLRRMDGDQ